MVFKTGPPQPFAMMKLCRKRRAMISHDIIKCITLSLEAQCVPCFAETLAKIQILFASSLVQVLPPASLYTVNKK